MEQKYSFLGGIRYLLQRPKVAGYVLTALVLIIAFLQFSLATESATASEGTNNASKAARQLQVEGARMQLQGNIEGAITKYKESLSLQSNERLEGLLKKLESSGDEKKSTTNTSASSIQTDPTTLIKQQTTHSESSQILKDGVQLETGTIQNSQIEQSASPLKPDGEAEQSKVNVIQENVPQKGNVSQNSETEKTSPSSTQVQPSLGSVQSVSIQQPSSSKLEEKISTATPSEKTEETVAEPPPQVNTEQSRVPSENVALIVDSKSPSNQIVAAKNGQSLAESDQLGGAKGNVVNVLTGQPIAGAQVISTTSTNIESEQRYKQVVTKTATDGSFIAEGLRNKSYSIKIVKDGFTTAESYAQIPAKSNVLIEEPISMLPLPQQGRGIYVYTDTYNKLTQTVPFELFESTSEVRNLQNIVVEAKDLKSIPPVRPKFLILYDMNYSNIDKMYLLFRHTTKENADHEPEATGEYYTVGAMHTQFAETFGSISLGCGSNTTKILRVPTDPNPLHFWGMFKCVFAVNNISVLEVGNIPMGYYFLGYGNRFHIKENMDTLILNYQ